MVYAGGVWAVANQNFYLYTSQSYWTISPSTFSSDGYAQVFMLANGIFTSPDANNRDGVRPVINLRSDVTLTGSGTTSDPYRVS